MVNPKFSYLHRNHKTNGLCSEYILLAAGV